MSAAEIDGQLREIAVRERVEAELGDDVEVTDADVRAYYDEQRETRFERLRARHILVETEEEAEEALARLEAEEDFAVVAEEVSIDPGSGAEGGDLGEFARGQMVPEFEDAAFAADIGETVGPVESQFGFHIIEVLERVEEDFADVEDDLRDELVQQQLGDTLGTWLQGQTREADITVNPRFGTWDAERGEVLVSDPLDNGPAGPAPAPPAPPAPAPDSDPDVELELDED